MQMAIDVAGFDAGRGRPAAPGDGLQAVGASGWSGIARPALRGDGRATASPATLADDIYVKLAAFANYGFPESHAMSFAYLVYASAWLKRYHPAAFCAALLNAQPMGFYSPQSLVDDARRHGVEVRRPDINASDAAADAGVHAGRPGGARRRRASRRTPGAAAVRRSGSGCPSVRTLGDELAERIEAERARGRAVPGHAPTWPGRAGCSTAAQLEALATADAFACFGLTRREALWAAGAAAQDRPDRLPGTVTGARRARRCPGWTTVDALVADVWATGLSPDSHPAQFVRDQLDRGRRGADRRGWPRCEAGTRVRVGGDRHPPAAAGDRGRGHLPQPGGRDRDAQRDLLAGAVAAVPAGGAHGIGDDHPGRLELVDGVVNLVADHLAVLALPVRSPSRDFRVVGRRTLLFLPSAIQSSAFWLRVVTVRRPYGLALPQIDARGHGLRDTEAPYIRHRHDPLR